MPHTRDFLTVVRGPTPTPLGLAWVENGLAHSEVAQISSAQPKLQVFCLRAKPASEVAAATPGTSGSGICGKGDSGAGHGTVAVGRGSEFPPDGPRTATCIFRMFSLSRLFTMESTASCTRSCCSSAIATPDARGPTWTPRTGPPPRRSFPGQRGGSFPGPRRRLASERSNCTPAAASRLPPLARSSPHPPGPRPSRGRCVHLASAASGLGGLLHLLSARFPCAHCDCLPSCLPFFPPFPLFLQILNT